MPARSASREQGRSGAVPQSRAIGADDGAPARKPFRHEIQPEGGGRRTPGGRDRGDRPSPWRSGTPGRAARHAEVDRPSRSRGRLVPSRDSPSQTNRASTAWPSRSRRERVSSPIRFALPVARRRSSCQANSSNTTGAKPRLSGMGYPSPSEGFTAPWTASNSASDAGSCPRRSMMAWADVSGEITSLPSLRVYSTT